MSSLIASFFWRTNATACAAVEIRYRFAIGLISWSIVNLSTWSQSDIAPPSYADRYRAVHGSARSRAGRLVQRGAGGGPRPRGSPRDLPQPPRHTRDRGAGPHSLQAG